MVSKWLSILKLGIRTEDLFGPGFVENTATSPVILVIILPFLSHHRHSAADMKTAVECVDNYDP